MSLRDKILADLIAADLAEPGQPGGICWTKAGRKKYGGEWPNHPDNYAADLAERITDIYGPLATVGIPGAAFGSVEIKLTDLPEVVKLIEDARQQSKPVFMTGVPLAAVFQTGNEDYYFTDGKIHVESKNRQSLFSLLAARVRDENPGREVLSLYLADGSSNIIFDEPGKPNEEHSLFGTLRQLIKWIGARVHNDKLRRQLANELMTTALFTFDDLAFAVYKSEDGKFYCWNETDNFETHKDAAAAMLDFIKGQDEDSETVKTSDIMFGVVRTEGSDFDLYTANEDMQGEYFDSTAELPNAAATLANHLYNEYKATPFGKLADKVVVLTRQTNGDFMAALEGHDGPIGGAFRRVAPEVLKVIADLADDDQKAQFAKIFATGEKIETAKMKLLLTGIVESEGGKYIVKTGADDYRRYDNRADAEAAYKAHFLSDKIFEAGLKSVLAAPPVKPATEHLIAGVFHKDGGRYELRGSVVGKAEAVESVMLTEVLTNLQTWLNSYELSNRPPVKVADPTEELDPARFYGVRKVDAAGGSYIVYNGRQPVSGPLMTFTAALQAMSKYWLQHGYSVGQERTEAADDGDLLLIGLYQKPASVGGYYMTGAVPAVQFETRNSAQVLRMMNMYIANWYKEEAHYPDPNGRIVVGLDPASNRPDDAAVAFKLAYPDAFPLFFGGRDEPAARLGERESMLITGLFRTDDGRYFLRGVDGENVPEGFEHQTKILISSLYEYGRSKSYTPAFGNWLELINLFLENKASMTLTETGERQFYASGRPEAARQVVGLYDYGDDGKTFYVSSELPGRMGRLLFSSRETAADRAAKVIADYLQRFGLPVARWNGYGGVVIRGGQVIPFNDTLDNMAAGFSALTTITAPEAREILEMIVDFATSGPLTFQRLKHVFTWLNTPQQAQQPTGAVSNFGPFVAPDMPPAEAQRRQEYATRFGDGQVGAVGGPYDGLTDPEEPADDYDEFREIAGAEPDPEQFRDLDSSCGE